MKTNSFFSQCEQITIKLKKSPISSFFSIKFAEMSGDQKRNIWDRILTKLHNKLYQSPKEWFNEVNQIFLKVLEMTQEDQNSSMHALGQYLHDDFTKKARFLIMSNTEWIQETKKLLTKINNVTEKSPIPQSFDPFAIGIARYASRSSAVSTNLFAWISNSLNELSRNQQRKDDICQILHQHSIEIRDSGKLIINLELCSQLPKTLQLANALYWYLIAHLQELPPSFQSTLSNIEKSISKQKNEESTLMNFLPAQGAHIQPAPNLDGPLLFSNAKPQNRIPKPRLKTPVKKENLDRPIIQNTVPISTDVNSQINDKIQQFPTNFSTAAINTQADLDSKIDNQFICPIQANQQTNTQIDLNTKTDAEPKENQLIIYPQADVTIPIQADFVSKNGITPIDDTLVIKSRSDFSPPATTKQE